MNLGSRWTPLLLIGGGILAATLLIGQAPAAFTQEETPTVPGGPPPDPCSPSLGEQERLEANAATLEDLDACLASILEGIDIPTPPVLDALGAIRAGCVQMDTRIDLFLDGTILPTIPPDLPPVWDPDPCGNPALDDLGRLEVMASTLTYIDGCLQGVLVNLGTVPDPAIQAALEDIAFRCQVMIARIDTFLGTTPPTQEPGAHARIEPILQAVDALAADKALNRGRHNTLRKKLDVAKADGMQANPLGVIRHLGRFQRKAEAFVRGGVLSEGAGGPLIAMAAEAADQVRASAFAPIQVPLPGPGGCPEPPFCIYTTLHVAPAMPGHGIGRAFDPGDHAAPDGSAERPYPAIAQALDHAEEADLCAVLVQVADGCYPGDLEITRPTRIVGEGRVVIVGSIVNRGPHEIGVETVTLSRGLVGCPLPPGSSEGGAIEVDHPCASTTLTDIRIEGAIHYGIYHRGGTLTVDGATIEDTQAALGAAWDFRRLTGAGIYLIDDVSADLSDITIRRSERYGLRQRGGRLNLHDVRIEDTLAQEEISAAGTAVWLSEGVLAALQFLTITRSGSSALIIQSEGTEVDARILHVTDTEINPYLWERPRPTYVAAIDVRGGAVLDVDWLRHFRSEITGLRVADGARARLVDAYIAMTEQVPGPVGGGFNISALDFGEIELWDFTSSDAGLCGLQVARGGTIDAHVGLVLRNPIGANVQTEGFDIDRLRDRVEYLHNEHALDASALPVPQASTGL